MTQVVDLSDMLRYGRYESKKGLSILINDRFNYHLREWMIRKVTIVQDGDDGTTVATVELDPEPNPKYGKLRYRGTFSVRYVRTDAYLVFLNGIVIPDHYVIPDITNQMITRRIRDYLNLHVPEDTFELVYEYGRYLLRFNDRSVFWQGEVMVRRQRDATPGNWRPPLHIYQDDPILQGFKEPSPLGLNSIIYNYDLNGFVEDRDLPITTDMLTGPTL